MGYVGEEVTPRSKMRLSNLALPECERSLRARGDIGEGGTLDNLSQSIISWRSACAPRGPMLRTNLMIVQGGGPTAVFNASLAEIIVEAQRQPSVGRILGAR